MRAASSSAPWNAPCAALGHSKKRAPEYVLFRMLEVEAAANAVYAWAAEQVFQRCHAEERPSDPAEHAAAVHPKTPSPPPVVR